MQTLTVPCPLSSQLVAPGFPAAPCRTQDHVAIICAVASYGRGSDAGKSQDTPQPRGL